MKKENTPKDGNIITPIITKDTNTAIAKNQEQYQTLPAHIAVGDDEYGRVIITYQLTFLQRLKLLFTGLFYMQLFTFGGLVQPQLLSLKNFINDLYLPADEIWCSLSNDAKIRVRLFIGMPIIVNGKELKIQEFGRETVQAKDANGNAYNVDKNAIKMNEDIALENMIEDDENKL